MIGLIKKRKFIHSGLLSLPCNRKVTATTTTVQASLAPRTARAGPTKENAALYVQVMYLSLSFFFFSLSLSHYTCNGFLTDLLLFFVSCFRIATEEDRGVGYSPINVAATKR